MIPTLADPAEETHEQNPLEGVESGMLRTKDAPEPDKGTTELVGRWQNRVTQAKKKFENDFSRIKEDQRFARGAQWNGKEEKDKYTANIIQRHIAQKVASLYAKNPKVVVKKRRKLDFELWDGSTDSLQNIQQTVMMAMQAGAELPPQALALVNDIAQGTSRKIMLGKVAETLQVIFDHVLTTQNPPFKLMMKQLVRRVCTCGVGYVKLGFMREMERTPDDVDRVNGMSEQISSLERVIADRMDGELEEETAELAQLKLALADYQQREKQITREGITFDFPAATSIIVDPNCNSLVTFTGAQWIAQEFILSVDDVKEIYGVDLSRSGAVSYQSEPSPAAASMKEAIRNGTSGQDVSTANKKVEGVKVWEIWDKRTGTVLTIADGYNNFLREPAQPAVVIPRFWPIFSLVFNEIEDEEPEGLYPRSDVHLLKSMQLEYNRSREGLRQHRIANRPKIGVPAGMLSETDKELLQSHPAFAVIELQGMSPDADINKILQPIKGAPIADELYDTAGIFEDSLRVIGQSDASLGSAQGGVTATGDSIAEQNRTIATASNVDDLDDMLSELARSAGIVLLSDLSADEAKRIAGVGAAWPSLANKDIVDEIHLDIEAGSSGRPNKALEIANLERLAPFLIQIPGVRPDWLLKQFIQRIDDSMDITDALCQSLPAIVAQNAMSKAGPPGGIPGAPPAAQGDAGANNAPALPGGQAPQIGAPPQSQLQAQTGPLS